MKQTLSAIVTLLGLCAISACSDVSTVSDSTFVVRGEVMTGATQRAAVAGGYVRVLMPQATGAGHWIGLDFGPSSGVPNVAVTNSDGSYTFTVDVSDFDSSRSYPMFLAASDSAQTLTMLAELPQDTAIADARLTIDINPTSTVASEMICPGGAWPPPANSWCYSDPNNASADDTAMQNVIGSALGGSLSSLSTGTPPNWQTFASGFLDDPATYGEIKNILTGQGITFGTATPSSITTSIAALPLAKAPLPGDSNTPPPTPSSGGGSCQLVWDCNNVAGCIADYGADTGTLDEPDLDTCNMVCMASGACYCSSGCQ